MNNMEYLFKKYKEKVIPKEASAIDIKNFLAQRFDIREINLQLLSPIYLKFMKENAKHYSKNIQNSEMDFVAYEIIENEKSKDYYNDVDQITENRIIVVLIENNIRYSAVNNGKLQLEILIKWGVSKYDYDNNTEELAGYLSYLERYEENFNT